MTVYVCAEKDHECGSNPASWCQGCPMHNLRLRGAKYIPKNAYSPFAPGFPPTVIFRYLKVHCKQCAAASGAHTTCEHCGFHGDFEEPGESAQCPECNWGMPT